MSNPSAHNMRIVSIVISLFVLFSQAVIVNCALTAPQNENDDYYSPPKQDAQEEESKAQLLPSALEVLNGISNGKNGEIITEHDLL